MKHRSGHWSLAAAVAPCVAVGLALWADTAGALTNMALAPSGVITSSPGSYSPSYPISRLHDGPSPLAWIGPSNVFTNAVQFAFDPNFSGVTGAAGDAADHFLLDNVTVRGTGSTASIRQFMLYTEQASSPGIWNPLYAKSGGVTDYNFAMTAQGGRFTVAPGVYSGSYPFSRLIDGSANNTWIGPSGTYANTFDLEFDPNLNGTTGLAGDTADRFTLTNLAVTGDASTAMLKQFAAFAQSSDTPGVWQQLFKARGVVNGYNFAMSPQGGQFTVAPGTYSASYPSKYLIDGTSNTQWIASSGVYANTMELAFDPNLNGTTSLGGDTADPFTFNSVAVTGDGGTSMLKQFSVSTKVVGSSVWTPQFAAVGGVSGYNFGMAAQGGIFTAAPGVYNASYPFGYLIDGTANTQWIAPSGVFANTIDLAFDPNLNGTTGLAGDAADPFTFTGVAVTGDGGTSMLKQFTLFAQTTASPGVWQQIYSGTGAVSSYNFAMAAQGGRFTAAPGVYNGSYPFSYLIDGTANTQWIGPSGVYANTVDLAFDPNLNGTTGLAGDVSDPFTLTGVAMTGDGGNSMLKQFTLFAQTTGSPGVWQQLFSGSGSVTGYNYAMSAQGGQMTAPPGVYNPSYPTRYLNDGTPNTQWIGPSGVYANTMEFAFDPNLNGTTGLAGDAADPFRLTSVAMTGDGGTSMLKQFTLFTQTTASPGVWQQAFVGTGAVTGYNFAMAAQGGRFAAAPGSFSASYPSAYLIDGTANSQWIGPNSVYANTMDLVFDPNLNGTTSLGGDAADPFTFTGVAVAGDGGTSMLRQFALFAQTTGSPGVWQRLFSATGSVTGYNFAMAHQGGTFITAPGSYSGSYPSSNLIDGTANTQWIAPNGVLSNTIDLEFDPSLNGTTGRAGDVADHFTLTGVAITGDGGTSMVRQFQVFAQDSGAGTWTPLTNASSGTTTFTASRNATRQTFTFTSSLNNVRAVRIVTVSNYGQGYLSINELEVLGNGSANQPLFTTTQSNAKQSFSPTATLANVTAVRVQTINNFGQAYVSLNELEVIGNGNANQPLFTLAQNNTRQSISLSSAVNNVTAVRVVTVNNYGQAYLSLNEVELNGSGSPNQPLFTMNQSGSRQVFNMATLLNNVTAVRVGMVNNFGQAYVSLNELEVIGNGNAAQPLFTLARNTSRQEFSLPASVANVVAVRVQTVNNHGQAYLSVNELEVLGDGSANQPLFTTVRNTTRQTFPLLAPVPNVTTVQVKTVNNFGQAYVSLNELEVIGDGNANQPLFTTSQNASRQTFGFTLAAGGTSVANTTAVRAVTVNNYGQAYVSLNQFEALGSATLNQPLFTALKNGSTQVFSLNSPANAGRLDNIIGLRFITVNNYGYYYTDVVEFEAWGGPPTGAVGAFNAFEVGTLPATAGGVIKTKISGTPFSLDVVALNAPPALATTFTGTVQVELVDATSTALSCANWPVIGTSGSIAFVSSDGGRKTIAFTENNAYRNVRVRMKYAAVSPTVTACSADNFAIRPDKFLLAVTDNDPLTAGTAGVLDNTALAGGRVHKAGRPFTLTVSALNAASTPGITTLYTGSPVPTTPTFITPNSCTGCSLMPGTLTAVAGVAVSNTATYNEVGTIGLKVEDTSFAAVDDVLGDSSLDDRTIASAVVNVGRFIPDHFALVAGAVTPGCSNAFTYFGQDGFTTPFILRAENAANAVTANYAGSLAKLPLNDWSRFVFTPSATLPTGSTLSASTTAPTGSWSAGVATVSARHLVSRPTAVTTETLVTLRAQPVDDEGVTFATEIDGVTVLPRAVSTGASELRLGRLRLANAIGSDTRNLAMPLTAQFFRAGAPATWVINSQDSCTVVPASAVNFGNYRRALVATDSVLVSLPGVNSGTSTLLLQRPAAGHRGTFDVSLSLGAAATDSSCLQAWAPGVAASAGANLAYLRGAWCGSSPGNDPSARASFGLYKGADSLIFQRERY